MNTFFIGTSNNNKKKEIDAIFKDSGLFYDIKTPTDFNDTSEPIEDGNSFVENAIIKAKFYFDKYHIPCIGEDSGICIEYFGNFPGIHSKRFMNSLSDKEKNDYVLSLMKDVRNRKATFHAVVCYIDKNDEYHIFEGINNGEILFEQKGEQGFGYDPIFFIPEFNKTEAELGLAYKNEHGHRAKAFKKLIEYIKNE